MLIYLYSITETLHGYFENLCFLISFVSVETSIISLSWRYAEKKNNIRLRRILQPDHNLGTTDFLIFWFSVYVSRCLCGSTPHANFSLSCGFIIPNLYARQRLYVFHNKLCPCCRKSPMITHEQFSLLGSFRDWCDNFPYSKSSTPAADSLPFIRLNQPCQQKLVQPRLKAHRLVADTARL